MTPASSSTSICPRVCVQMSVYLYVPLDFWSLKLVSVSEALRSKSWVCLYWACFTHCVSAILLYENCFYYRESVVNNAVWQILHSFIHTSSCNMVKLCTVTLFFHKHFEINLKTIFKCFSWQAADTWCVKQSRVSTCCGCDVCLWFWLELNDVLQLKSNTEKKNLFDHFCIFVMWSEDRIRLEILCQVNHVKVFNSLWFYL